MGGRGRGCGIGGGKKDGDGGGYRTLWSWMLCIGRRAEPSRLGELTLWNGFLIPCVRCWNQEYLSTNHAFSSRRSLSAAATHPPCQHRRRACHQQPSKPHCPLPQLPPEKKRESS